MVYRRATASGTVPRAPGWSNVTCIGHTKDELRSPYDGRVMIIWVLPYEIIAHICVEILAHICVLRYYSCIISLSVLHM